MTLPGRILLLAVCVTLGACAQLPARDASIAIEQAVMPGTTAELDRMTQAVEQIHPGESAFRLADDGYEAFALRMHSAALAERSLDVQTYIWHSDIAGTYLANALLRAADRGVRVRILVDDVDARQNHDAFTALAAHRNVSVRIFNPFASRYGFFSKLTEGVRRFSELNRRMHNKSWIADNRIAIAGGRNLGDEYFNASEGVNFVDLDMAMIGPVVREVSHSFDRYWNAASSYPVDVLTPQAVTDEALAALRERIERRITSAGASRYATVLRDDPAVQRLLHGTWPMQWTADYQFWSDDPLKAVSTQRQGQGSHVLTNLLDEIATTRERLWIISPYFVPGVRGAERLASLAARGVDVRVITNSLAANDVVAVHSGYEKYRQLLLENGVRLWELKPLVGESSRTSLFGSSGASLHTKALVIDGAGSFVGSYNLDPRSTALNSEQGIFVRSDVIGGQIQELFLRQSSGQKAWQLHMSGENLVWIDDDSAHNSEPMASWLRRVMSEVLGWLPLERQL
ncbi:MAG: phospholipase D-like domain-containing protein [Pseudomonas sp.]